MNQILVFDIWGDWGFFRKIETTSSPQSYSFPPRTTITGIIAAILGYDRDSYYSIFEPKNSNVAIQILTPIIKCKMNINLVNTKTLNKNFLFGGRTQIPFEFVKNPKYRIFFWHNNPEIYSELKNMLETHTSKYTPTLGLAGNIANFKFIGEFKINSLTEANKSTEVVTVVKSIYIEEISDIKQDYSALGKTSKEYVKENMPCYFNPTQEDKKKRECREYAEYLFDRKGKPILLKFKGANYVYTVDFGSIKQNISFL